MEGEREREDVGIKHGPKCRARLATTVCQDSSAMPLTYIDRLRFHIGLYAVFKVLSAKK